MEKEAASFPYEATFSLTLVITLYFGTVGVLSIYWLPVLGKERLDVHALL